MATLDECAAEPSVVPPLDRSRGGVPSLLLEVGGMVSLPKEATTAHRREIYRAAGVRLFYDRSSEGGESLTASLGYPESRGVMFRVEGET